MQIKEAIEDIKLSKSTVLFGREQTIVNIEAIETVLNELEKKDKVIDEMAKQIAVLNYEFIGPWCKTKQCERVEEENEWGLDVCDRNNLNCIKKYFYKEVSDEKC